jgi:lysine-N-methylase
VGHKVGWDWRLGQCGFILGSPVVSPPTITTRSVSRFRCIAEACEDNCCHGWSVPVERLTYDVLKAKLDRSPAEREEFRAALLRGRRPRTDAHYASMRLQGKEENCPFLKGGLCSVHGRFGEAALPEICATYPRVTSRTDQRFEVFGYLSCPEMARLSLLSEDGMDMVPADGPPPRIDLPPPHPPSPYDRHLDDVRGTAVKVLSARAYPIGTRLFLLAYLGQRTAGYFHRGIDQLDQARLAGDLAEVADDACAAGWQRELANMPVAGLAAARIVTDLLRLRLESVSGRFHHLVVAALTSHGDDGGVSVDQAGQLTMDLPVLWASYERRRDTWRGLHAARIDLYFENFAKTYWQREWYTRSPDLTIHMQTLLVRIAVLRFLLFSHPALQAALALEPGERQAALDRTAVEVFYKFSRAVEHEGKFLAEIAATLVDLGDKTFAHSINLALG